MTNHDLARQLLDFAKRNNGLWIGATEHASIDTIQAMFDQFIAEVPEKEVAVNTPLTIGGLKVMPNPSLSVGYIKIASPTPTQKYEERDS